MSAKLGLTFALLAAACAAQSCVSCDPSGWTTATLPPLGSGLENLYVDLVNSVAGITFKDKRAFEEQGALKPRASAPICCDSSTTCLLLQGMGVPFCYDKFTTNYLFPDGSFGTIATGAYTAADGETANLITGDYTANGQSENIYSADAGAKPNTATLSVPAQFTASGVGSAIPISELGSLVYILSTSTGTTVVPGTTVEATSVESETVAGSVVAASTVVAPSTVPPQTITTEATITVSTSTRTLTPSSSSAAAAAATTSKKGAASRAVPALFSWGGFGEAAFGILLYRLLVYMFE